MARTSQVVGARSAALPRLIALAAALLIASASAARTETLRIGGTGTALAGMRMLGSAFEKQHQDVDIAVLPSLGSSGGIKALLHGDLDLAVTARPLKARERDAGARARPYARTPLLFATSINAPVKGIGLDELVDIYAGRMIHWQDGSPIRLILRSPEEADILLLRKVDPAVDQALDDAMRRTGLILAKDDQENADVLESLQGTFGMITLAQILTEERRLKPLAFQGIEPSVANLETETYPLAKPLELVTGPGSPLLALEFVEFVASADGRSLLAASGHLPSGGE